ncbi:MAG TPA: RNA-binding protein [Candidatus Saccharimonadia bacterium]
MAKKLFVGNLPYNTTNEDLQKFFEQFGEVASAAVIMDRATGRSKGFGFVEFDKDEEADAAIAKANTEEGALLDGRKLTVSEARPKAEAGAGGGNRY